MREGPKWVPGVVRDQIGWLTYLVQVSRGLQWRKHIDHLRDVGSVDPDLSTRILPDGEPEDQPYPVQSHQEHSSSESGVCAPKKSLSKTAPTSFTWEGTSVTTSTEPRYPASMQKPRNHFTLKHWTHVLAKEEGNVYFVLTVVLMQVLIRIKLSICKCSLFCYWSLLKREYLHREWATNPPRHTCNSCES